jgi:hypothetical protein
MIAIVFLFIRMLCDCFKPRGRLEAEILVLRHAGYGAESQARRLDRRACLIEAQPLDRLSRFWILKREPVV